MNNFERKKLTYFCPSSNIPSFSEFDLEKYCMNATRTLCVSKNQDHIVHKLFKERIHEVRKEIYHKIQKPFKPIIIKPNMSHKELQLYVKQIPCYKMILSIEEGIIERLGKSRFVENYISLIPFIMAEVKEEYYIKPLYNLNMDIKVQLTELSEFAHKQLSSYKYLGRTRSYMGYLKVREYMNYRLFITYPLVKSILSHAVVGLPNIAFHFNELHRLDGLDLQEVHEIIQKRLMRANLKIEGDWYMEIIKFISRDEMMIKESHLYDYLNCAEGLISLHVSLMIRRTIKEFVSVICHLESTPFLKVKLFHDFELKLIPSPEQIEEEYNDILCELSEMMSYMRTLEYFCTTDCTTMYIKLDIPQDFLNKQMKVIKSNINIIFKPVTNYIKWLEQKYAPLYDEQKQASQVNDPNLPFDKGCELIEFYRSYLVDLRDMIPNVYFEMCILDESHAIAHLKNNGERVITALTSKLMNLHKYENQDICEMFEFLKIRAETVPQSTDELMELSSYMIWATINHLAMLHERVQNSIGMMIRLIEITKVSNECIIKMTETINWCFDIKPVLEKNASMLERVKFEFEEFLQRRIDQLITGIRDMVPFLETLNDMDDSDRAHEYLVDLRSLIKKIRKMDELLLWINKEESLFKFPVSTYPELENLKQEIYPFFRLVGLCHKWNRYFGVWMDGPFEHLDIENVTQIVDDYYKEITKMFKLYKTKIKQSIADNNPNRFKGLLDDPDPMNLPAPLKLCTKTLQYIKDFRPNMVLISIFCSTALCQRHWDEMSNIAGYDMTPDAGTTLRKLMNKDFGQFLDQFEIISTGAIKERQLQINLMKMMAEWEQIRFKTTIYKDTKLTILTALDDIQAILDDHIIKTLTMRGSVFVKHIETEVKAWYEKILRINNTIEEWSKVQSQWLYLLPIFSSKDIVAQMPEEGVLFKEVDNTYRRYMLAVQKDNRVIETAGALGMLEAMRECTKMLDQINDGVSNYLEKKRLVFPRFFFLSNDEMLEILSETKNPLRVQPHLRKCFEGINKLEFDTAYVIYGMFSQEGENINFMQTIDTEEARGSVEKWLVQVECQMIASVKNEIFMSYESYQVNLRTTWVQLWAAQAILAISQIYWTIDVHSCLDKNLSYNLKDFHMKLNIQLQDIVTLVRSSGLSNLARTTIKALIVIDVHAKDVVQELVKCNVREDSDFKWLAQLRYYWEDNCLVRMINATVPYAYEYLGNSDRLVITPLTDRCYITLIGAYHLHLNGAPEGPAGTGKTETTKDLAKALAVQCVVFNCSDGLDYKAMGKFFKGLASSGAWACFDEFNRIELEVLSVVAQQILSIVLAVRGNFKTFLFEGTELVLNSSVYICITMNPGYAGRSELPDNLKVLFRTVAMMVPDYAMIGEISLYSYGFKNARTLSVKIVTTYKLCSEQLSSQNHYDYGMRAVKTVLSACGNIKRKFPDENEDILLLRSLVDVNLPKFLSYDVPLFEGIISDLFPNISLPTPDYGDLLTACELSCSERVLQRRQSFMLKIVQTYEMMIVRHGFMLVGDPFSGKSSTLKVLADALTYMSEKGLNQVPVHYQFINPKSITMGQLYGQFDPVSYEWTDGIVATCFRKFCMDERPDRNWVIFDGPVDAVWIENMNTVLDDNKKLCLTSGEVMAMTNSMSMIFEVMDLAQASPATVSRCGMIYLESGSLGWRPFLESWIQKVNSCWSLNNEHLFYNLFDWLLTPCLSFINKHCHQLVYPGEINVVLTSLKIIEINLNCAIKEYEDDSVHMSAWIQATVMLSLVWGVAGILDSDSRIKFDEFYKDLWKGANEKYPLPESFEKIEVTIPTEGLLMDYLYIYKTSKGSWKYWPDLVKQQKIDENVNVQQILVPTVDTVRYIHIVKMHIQNNIPILLVGPTGTGKSFYLQDLLMYRLNQDSFEPAFITFTAQTLPNQTQELIISKLMKGKKGHYYAPKGKISVIFIDDMNMPAKDTYGAQPPIELLRQFF